MKHPPIIFVTIRQPAALPKCAKAGRRPSGLCYTRLGSPATLEPKPDQCAISIRSRNQAAIIALFRVVNRYVGNLAHDAGGFSR